MIDVNAEFAASAAEVGYTAANALLQPTTALVAAIPMDGAVVVPETPMGFFSKTVEIAKEHPVATAAVVLVAAGAIGYGLYKVFSSDKEKNEESK